ncbi:NUDIX hydrolase [Streptococcus merionis]|uniref:MutT/NUDIX hydrolase family protein n=1 Tax=Streptococcus merionis TaxID=400065 RepID=A0A239SZL4_9STRE|nr:NUDIX domain-containing protein [Streptococcus merionis]SNU90318.1 MutT/NUDIX hydrolase family protein [Streptococcus merionis]
MSQDFRTRIDNQVFGVRASGLIIKDDQIYLYRDDRGGYYVVGGAVAVGETTEEAVKREILEEIGLEVQIEKLAFIVENQFCQGDVNFHNIEFHYRVTPLSLPNQTLMEDGKTMACEWVKLDNVDKIDIRPAFLKTALKNWNGQVTHIINKG